MKIIKIIACIVIIARGLLGIYDYFINPSAFLPNGQGRIWGFAGMIIAGIWILYTSLKKSKIKD